MIKVFFSSKSDKFLDKVDENLRQRILNKIDGLKTNPFPSDVKRIKGEKEKSFRIRVGKYLIKYYFIQNKKEILIFDIDKRDKVYD
jgi:mRNA interferase RelE/StbE